MSYYDLSYKFVLESILLEVSINPPAPLKMSYKGLIAYQKSFALALNIFKISKKFPKDELFGLTSQIRRSSRSVCSNIVEAYRKRKFEAYFVSKLSDADMENSETQLWLDFALSFEYLNKQEYSELYSKTEEIGRLIFYMSENPKKFLPTSIKNENKNGVI